MDWEEEACGWREERGTRGQLQLGRGCLVLICPNPLPGHHSVSCFLIKLAVCYVSSLVCVCVNVHPRFAGQLQGGMAGHQDVESPKAEVAKWVTAPRLSRTPEQTQNSGPHWRGHGGVRPWVSAAENE